MSRRSIGREFISLSKYDSLTVVSLFLRERQYIKDVMSVLDHYYDHYRKARAFFAYELMSQRKDHELTFQIVMCYDTNDLSRIFKSIKCCVLVQIQPVMLVTLYTRLLNSSFRVYKRLLFDRLKVSESQAVAYGTNLFTRMVNIDRNVLSMREVGYEEELLEDLHYDLKYSKQNGTEAMLFQEQVMLQKYLFGSCLRQEQIHIPLPKRDAILLSIQARQSQMRDCFPDKIISQQQEMSLLVSALQTGLQMQY